MNPKVIEEKWIYKGKIFDVSTSAILEDEVVYEREIVHHKGSAVIVPVFEDLTVALVRQYRHPAADYLWELPAGSLAENEDPESGAKRELAEEIGVRAGTWQKLAAFYVSPGFLTEKMFLFLATNLQNVGQNLEADELLSIKRFDFETLRRMIGTGELADAKTIAGIFLAASRLNIAL